MKFFLIFTLLLCSTFHSAFGQSQNVILTREQNNKWLDSLKGLSFNQQLLTIKNRLLSDTNIFVRQSYSDRIRVTDFLGSRVYGDGKPTLIIGGYAMIIDNKTETSRIVSLTNLLTQAYIREILILSPDDPATTAIYGREGKFGVFVMTVTKKKYAKLFKRLKLKQNY